MEVFKWTGPICGVALLSYTLNSSNNYYIKNTKFSICDSFIFDFNYCRVSLFFNDKYLFSSEVILSVECAFFVQITYHLICWKKITNKLHAILIHVKLLLYNTSPLQNLDKENLCSSLSA